MAETPEVTPARKPAATISGTACHPFWVSSGSLTELQVTDLMGLLRLSVKQEWYTPEKVVQ
ncbi:hypothetical protein GCM10008938_46830 [Deinococcus roseus]|uniref:Uncharacterized protein n=1 Tax=Deinococcus roseus TaxID=392414 RepID=A0ABQ2DEH2_9DEIO|nr:hypothetical protein GCM10008938_46830 [Deinococcus roseus]